MATNVVAIMMNQARKAKERVYKAALIGYVACTCLTAFSQVEQPTAAAGNPPAAIATTQLTWTMVNVNHTPQQGDAHLLEFANGSVVLIDAGHLQPATDMLVPLLKSKGIKKIDLFFSTHPHKDHYQGLKAIVEAGIRIKEAYFNMPDKVLCDSEIPWGCDYQELMVYKDFLEKKGVQVKSAQAGQVFRLGSQSQLAVLYAFNGIDTPVGRTDVNDLSLIMKLTVGATRVLFTGDLNHKIGTWLASNGRDLRSTILKLPHHGTEGAAPDAFFDAVAPTIAMVPSPALLWCSDRSSRMRRWLDKRRIPSYVNGFSGHITVRIQGTKIKIQEQNAKRIACQPA